MSRPWKRPFLDPDVPARVYGPHATRQVGPEANVPECDVPTGLGPDANAPECDGPGGLKFVKSAIFYVFRSKCKTPY